MSDWAARFPTRPLPVHGVPAGYAALILRFGLNVPLPPRLAAVADRQAPRSTDEWLVVRPARRPADTLVGHLVFALRQEGIDLSVLAALFAATRPDELAAYVRGTPTGAAARRLWFLYEWLTGQRLEVPDAGKVRMVPAVDPGMQVALRAAIASPRHKVLDNLPGVPAFCPMVRWTPALVEASASRLDVRVREMAGRASADLAARAAAFLTLKDSKASFAIEREKASGSRAARWGQAIAEAGAHALSIAELERLQRLVIEGRFVRMGLRREGGYVGEHDRESGEPVPDHISARPGDLVSLLDGMIAYAGRTVAHGTDPVAAAAAVAFGFVYVHPFEDGNGRLHRWLIHHVLAAAGFTPQGTVFPVSAAILREVRAYREVLESYARPLLPFIEWRPTARHNIEVTNDTARFYRYFDATRHAEFLYRCVAQTLDRDLPEEVAFLQAYDRFNLGIQAIADMPARSVELLRAFLAQNNGRLSARARRQEFAMLSDAEAWAIERVYAESFPAPASA